MTVRSDRMRQGFTLIQISLLLLVASLALTTVLPSTQTGLRANSATNSKLNTILIALRQYQASHGRLPCPADASQPIGAASYGVEAANPDITTNCAGGAPAANYTDATNHVAIGMVPVRTLALSTDYALDAYGRDITYAVDTNATALGWATATLTGTIAVTDNGTVNHTVVSLVSHGADGHGAWVPRTGTSGTAVRLNAGSADADQLTNAHVGGNFAPVATLTNLVKKMPTATFDDMIVYKNPAWNFNKIPNSVPQITAVTPPANGCYSTGQALVFTLTYGHSVTVTGTPRLALTIGGATRYATYSSGSGTSALTFSYTVQNGDSAPAGISLTSPVDNNGGAIMNGLAYAVRALTPPDLSKVKINVCTVIYVVDYGNSRVQKFDGSGTFLLTFGSNGGGNGQFGTPFGAAVDASGNVWVADYGNNRVEKFDSNGNYLSKFGSSGSGNGQFNQPFGIAVDVSGNVFVVDLGNNRVQKFDSSGNYLSKFGSSGSGNGQFNVPAYVATDSSGNVYVTDFSNYRVEKFDNNGNYLSQFGSNGGGNGQFSHPLGITIDASGNIFVADNYNYRVQKFNSSGTYLSQLGGYYGSGNGQFVNPYNVGVDASGNIYVSDQANHRVEKFDNSGVYQSQFGSVGSGNGQFNAYGIAVGR